MSKLDLNDYSGWIIRMRQVCKAAGLDFRTEMVRMIRPRIELLSSEVDARLLDPEAWQPNEAEEIETMIGRQCEVPCCDRKHLSGGLCGTHYEAYRRVKEQYDIDITVWKRRGGPGLKAMRSENEANASNRSG